MCTMDSDFETIDELDTGDAVAELAVENYSQSLESLDQIDCSDADCPLDESPISDTIEHEFDEDIEYSAENELSLLSPIEASDLNGNEVFAGTSIPEGFESDVTLEDLPEIKDAPMARARDDTEMWEEGLQSIDETLDNYKENLKNHGMEAESSVSDYIAAERVKLQTDVCNTIEGNFETPYIEPDDWEAVAASLQRQDNTQTNDISSEVLLEKDRTNIPYADAAVELQPPEDLTEPFEESPKDEWGVDSLDEGKFPDEVLKHIRTEEESQVYLDAGLKPQMIDEHICLSRPSLDQELADYENHELTLFSGGTDGELESNFQRTARGRSPFDTETGEKIVLHHIGQESDSPFAELTESEHHDNDGILHVKTLESFRRNSDLKNNYNNKERPEHWKGRYRNEE